MPTDLVQIVESIPHATVLEVQLADEVKRLRAEYEVEVVRANDFAEEIGRLQQELAEADGVEGRCPVGHNRKFTYALNDTIGCVACERDRAEAALATERRDALEEGYLAGFLASGEGWNGEYPFRDNDRSPLASEDWIVTRDRNVRALAEKEK